MEATWSSKNSSTKSERGESALAAKALVISSKLWFTIFSSSRAASIASRQLPHSMLTGLAISWKTQRPPLFLWLLGKVSREAGQGLVVSREVGRHRKIDIGGVEFHVDLLVDQGLAVLVVVLPDLGNRHPDAVFRRGEEKLLGDEGAT